MEYSTGKIFGSTHYYINKGKKVVIHKGGTGSGKTFEIMLYLFTLALNTEDKIITVVSESVPHLKIGTIRILSNFCKPIGLWGSKQWNKTDSTWTSPTGSIIEFFSADRISKALGARRHYLYGNEVNSISLDVWDELARRSNIIIADFNPTSQFWLDDWMEYYSDKVVIKSNYKDNSHLPANERERIELRAAKDKNFKRIHIDCEYGIYKGLVFEDWELIDEMPPGDGKFGMDWGFSNDPSTLIHVIEDDENIFVDELLYDTGMLNKDIIKRLYKCGIRKNYDVIIADSSEPKSIKEIHEAGYDIRPAKKGPDSIRKGIDRIKSKKLHVTKRSVNIIKELRNYSWEIDKEGKPTNKPVDKHNHAIDPIRYATEPTFKFTMA